MDPQQKQLLQCVYRALEDAGVPMEDASGTRTGVFFGTLPAKRISHSGVNVSSHKIYCCCDKITAYK